jgi:hypothetical protein
MRSRAGYGRSGWRCVNRDFSKMSNQTNPTIINDDPWKGQGFKGLQLLGSWRNCPAMLTAQERGSVALEESELCQQIGCSAETIEQWLEKYWIEHDIHAVIDGTESCGAPSLSLVQQYSTLGFRHPDAEGYFHVRLFSPTAAFDAEYALQEGGKIARRDAVNQGSQIQ